MEGYVIQTPDSGFRWQVQTKENWKADSAAELSLNLI